ncbi:neugrin-like [Acipenser oxyrinchus oxyrinchus]|uniref:Neugrin n=1 Tax=Acipenser oxyrinchus oxyrinchus TaxID=40147 RepID=A0AAD8CMA8_ACIOX|nr:neugrin-like [Acipenser oxyrinchus oxyrinchus]
MFHRVCPLLLSFRIPAEPGPLKQLAQVLPRSVVFRCLSARNEWNSRAGPARERPGADRRNGSLQPELEDVEDTEERLEEVISAHKRRQRAMRLQRIRKEFQPPGPPERRLTWEAMEQIRYLRQESPEEWTVPQLAEGFDVSPDIIRRVLQSKFTPPLERKRKQDARVLSKIGLKPVPSGVQRDSKLPELSSGQNAMLPAPRGMKNTSSQAGDVSLTVRQDSAVRGGGLLTLAANFTMPSSAALQKAEDSGDSPALHSREIPKPEHSEERQGCSTEGGEEEEGWSGEVLTDQELERLAESTPQRGVEVVRKGNEFYDSEGNFLYRI